MIRFSPCFAMLLLNTVAIVLRNRLQKRNR